MEVTIRLPDLTHGFEYTGGFRKVNCGDLYINSVNSIDVWTSSKPSKAQFPIVRTTAVDPETGDSVAMPSKFLEFALTKYLTK